jgi:redox-sensitive bicupin YhaK (pirin superfamily)
MKTITQRNIERVVTAHEQLEGGGFVVRRPFPSEGLDHIDPFLLLDEFGPVDYRPGEAVGAPDHPHRGFETVSYMLEGEFEHADSAGHRGRLGPGDVQWMTAGRGIVHAEMPASSIREHGGRMHGFQLRVNLPAAEKMIAPRYQEVPASAIPGASSADGRAHVRVIAGEALGVQAVIDTRTPILYQDWRLDPGADLEQQVPESYHAFVYVYEGQAEIGNDEQLLDAGQAGILGPGDRVRLAESPGATAGARLLLLAGRPLGEPVARYGPFVMNTKAEIMQAVQDYRTGRLVSSGPS